MAKQDRWEAGERTLRAILLKLTNGTKITEIEFTKLNQLSVTHEDTVRQYGFVKREGK